MSSKRNHRIRSRKTYASRMYAARNALRGSMPWSVRQAISAALRSKVTPADQEETEEPANED